MTEPSRLIVLAGPTAVGKGTVAADVRRRHPEVWLSVSATTRAPRPGEENGVHYWFVSDDEFDVGVVGEAGLAHTDHHETRHDAAFSPLSSTCVIVAYDFVDSGH